MVIGVMLTGLVFSVMSAAVSVALGAGFGSVMAVYATGGATAVLSAALSIGAAPQPL